MREGRRQLATLAMPNPRRCDCCEGGRGMSAKNAWEATCRMCDKPLFWSYGWDEWNHTENKSVYCPGKSSSVAIPDDERSEA